MLSSRQLIYYLVTLAHGENVRKHLKSYRKNQYKSRSELAELQLSALKKLAGHAYANSLLYKTLWDTVGVHPSDIRCIQDLKAFPTINKEVLAGKRAELSTGRNPFWSSKTTGGSTGQAVTLLKNPGALARERAATWRAYEWAGIGVCEKQARLWGVPLRIKHKAKYRLIDFASNRIRFSAFDLSAESFDRYYQRIGKFKPRYLYGYVSMIVDFCNFLNDQGLRLPSSITAIVTTSEVLTEAARQKIEAATGVRVFNEYGCGEVGSIAHECEYGGFHTMADNLIVEIDSETQYEPGELIVTDLHNYATPLIRYRLGDFGTLSDAQCPCGRSLQLIRNIHGRAYDCIVNSDGKKFHPEIIMYVFEELKQRAAGIKQFQVIQKADSSLLVRIVRGSTFNKDSEEAVAKMLQSELGANLTLSFEYPVAIERERSGKLRLVKSELSQVNNTSVS